MHEVGECTEGPFLVLEYLPGQSLKEFIAHQRVPAGRAVELMVPVLRALVWAHAQGRVHHGLGPDTVRMAESGALKLLDFGLTPLLRGLVPGVATPPASPPQQREGGEPIDPRVDLRAVGNMLFQMIAVRPPPGPQAESRLTVTARFIEPMPRLRNLAPDTPPELAAIVDRCLLMHGDERFPDATALLRALEPFHPSHPRFHELSLEENPYPGLAAFQEEDAERFPGRTRELTPLVHRVHQRPLLAIVGPSGSGKSSLVRAGLVPMLKRSGSPWEALVIRPGSHPLAALASMLAPLESTPTSAQWNTQARETLEKRLRAEPGYAGHVLRTRAQREQRRILLFVDSFEELYTRVPDLHERLAFTACLSAIADDVTSPLRVVLALRSDSLESVSEDEHFMAELSQGLYFLTPLQREDLRDALVRPAERAGYRFESTALVVHMLQHLESHPGALPLLQFAATRLWEARDSQRKLLTECSYRAMGGIAGALASHADSVLASLSEQERAQVKALLLRLVTPERTRAIVWASELRERTRDPLETQRRIDHLVWAHLLVVRTEGGAPGATVELVHESLPHSWPTLKRWLDEAREDTLFLEQLRASEQQWREKNLDPKRLWHGERVDEARRFQRRFRGELPRPQRDYLSAVLDQSARVTRRKRALLASGVMGLGMLLTAVVGLGVQRDAREEAEARARVATAAEAVARGAETQAREAAATARQRLAEFQAQELKRREEQQAQEAAAPQVAVVQTALLNSTDRVHSGRQRTEDAQQRALPVRQRPKKDERVAPEAETQPDPAPDGHREALQATEESAP